jgi:hypothetical protein
MLTTGADHDAVGNMQKQRFLLIFFLSGAVGLIYEVVWARQLSLFLEIIASSVAAWRPIRRRYWIPPGAL